MVVGGVGHVREQFRVQAVNAAEVLRAVDVESVDDALVGHCASFRSRQAFEVLSDPEQEQRVLVRVRALDE